MKTPIVHETRRAGQAQTVRSSGRASLAIRTLIAAPPSRPAWDERARTEQRRAA